MNEPIHTTVTYVRQPGGKIHTYVDVREGEPPKYRLDRAPNSPLHDFGALRWLLESSIRRYHVDSGLPVPPPATYHHSLDDGEWRYRAEFVGRTFQASAPTRRKALRKLTRLMFDAWPAFALYVQFRQAADGHEWKV